MRQANKRVRVLPVPVPKVLDFCPIPVVPVPAGTRSGRYLQVRVVPAGIVQKIFLAKPYLVSMTSCCASALRGQVNMCSGNSWPCQTSLFAYAACARHGQEEDSARRRGEVKVAHAREGPSAADADDTPVVLVPVWYPYPYPQVPRIWQYPPVPVPAGTQNLAIPVRTRTRRYAAKVRTLQYPSYPFVGLIYLVLPRCVGPP